MKIIIVVGVLAAALTGCANVSGLAQYGLYRGDQFNEYLTDTIAPIDFHRFHHAGGDQ